MDYPLDYPLENYPDIGVGGGADFNYNYTAYGDGLGGPNGTQIPAFGDYGDYYGDYYSIGGNESCGASSNNFNFSNFEYHWPKVLWVPITYAEVLKILAYILLTLVSLIGNTLVILVVYYNSNMRSSTNQYLVNLAIADLLVTLTYPLHLVRNLSAHYQFHLPEIFCKLDGFVSTCILMASVLTLSVISLGRFVAVMFPLRARTSPDRARIVIAIIWLISIIIAGPILSVRRLDVREWADYTSYHCEEHWPTEYVWNDKEGHCEAVVDGRFPYYITLMVGFYFLPVTIMIVSYSLVILVLWATTLPGEHSQPGCNTQGRAKRKVLKMVTVVFLMFVICWTPLQGLLLYTQCIHDINKDGPMPEWFTGFEFAAYFLSYSNSAVNPIIYCGFNANFRHGLLALIPWRDTTNAPCSTRNSTLRWTYLRTRSITRRHNIDHTTYSGPEPVILLECNSFSKHRDASMISTVSMSSVGVPQQLDEATVHIPSWPPWQTNQNGQTNHNAGS